VNRTNSISARRPVTPPLHLARDTTEDSKPARESSGPRTPTAQAILKRQPGRERRRATRHPCQLQTACVVISLTEPILLKVRVRDLSQTGIGMVLVNRLPPGTFVAVKLQGPQPQPRIVRAQVIHATLQPGEKRTWLMGCRFVGTLAQDEIKKLI
jgi:hypothetical protein